MDNSTINYLELAEKIKSWGKELGFADVGFSDIDLSEYHHHFEQWLDNQYHGEMGYMANHGDMRAHPDKLHPGTIRVISVRMDYLPENANFAQTLKNKDHAYVSRYALGRDYHKLMRKRLKALGEKIKHYCHELDYRPFVDSAPILERPLAEKAGLGWVGKHSLLINKHAGSWFFLGELLVNIPLPISEKQENSCGSCVACIKICPTQAIVAPYEVDARRCISYLTIELREAIPIEFRPLIGNRIYGCDDCQLICPWNKFAQLSQETDFQARQGLDAVTLLELFAWDEETFLSTLQGSPIRRIGFECWQRNIAVALGNSDYSPNIISTLSAKRTQATAMVAEHIDWAIAQQKNKQSEITISVKQNKQHRLHARLVRSIEKGLPRDA
ncbi:tRNA epoxyqueuosine(34) reductase QueG [Thalassotalea hakodatensis]|uniref:tRNA epoxyqueuosine(34) reductase QueG n=1 Tax=Thalassotalea hakodatensis TaxID=3030492 RepID=UPI00257476AF|nr:tRNA epoxyqueuosine(34) reductase QueG [Thalassotalea hakodatensis]